MRKFRILSFILAILMLVPLIVSCKKNDESASNTDAGTVQAGDDRLPLSVAKEDNGGKEFKILMTESNTLDFVDEYGATVVSQALHKVDDSVNNHLGIKLEYTQLPGNWANRSTFNTRLLAMAMDSEAEFDLIMAETAVSYPYALQNDLVEDLVSIESIKLDSPWYLKDMVNTYGISGKLHGILGDGSLVTYESLGVIYFNQLMLQENKLTSPYELVEKGEWYLEDMFEMALQVGGTGDGNAADLKKDTFGYVGNVVASRGFIVGLNINVTEKSAEDGNVYLKTALDQRAIDIYDYLYDMFENNSAKLRIPVSADTELGTEAFSSGRALFFNGFLSTASKFSSVSWDYGIVPLPKYDETQTEFYSPAGTQNAIFMIMKNAADAELSGKVIETKAYYNHYDAVDSYYEQTLGYQYGRDPKHIDMLKIIRDSATMTFLAAMGSTMSPDPYNMYQMDTYWRNDKVNGSVSTYYNSNVTAWNNSLKTLYQKLS